jgi:putative ABC transport system ATP-binding protein
MTLLEGRSLTRKYQLPGQKPVYALKDVSCRIDAGSWTTVTGPSGSGKSSLLALLAALDRPTFGQVLVDGQDISFATDVRQALYRRERIGIVFQEYQLLERITAWENVAMPLLVTNMRYKIRQEKAHALLAEVGLAARAAHLPRQLSGGERQRVALARALVHNPDILFADEPTSNIDQVAIDQVLTIFHNLKNQGHTLVIVSHDPQMVERADQVLKLNNGVLVP